MGIFRVLRGLFSSNSSTSIDGDNMGVAGEDWRWSRVDEQPFDHYTDASDRVVVLKRERRHDEVEELLLWCIDYVEAEAEFEKHQKYGHAAIAPAYYRHLGIVYRKDGRYQDEVGILERYVKACRDLGGDPQKKMSDRLERARELAAESGS
ncbi:hypothetical protein C5C07_15285 [Haloferax sp. Atlit-4N]|nr:hypothetical protein C5C07_15285 [Haloferax sp. Atlit-4N]